MSTSEPVELSRRGRTAAGLIPAFAYAMLVALCLGAIWEAAVALGAFEIGPLPGQMPSGDEAFGGGAYLALIVGAIVLGAASFSTRVSARFAVARGLRFVTLAAAAFVTASFFSYDPYYAPDLHRFSDGRMFLAPWIAAFVGFGAFVAFAARRHPRETTFATAAGMWIGLVLFTLTLIGH